jgi:hypothetical protein
VALTGLNRYTWPIVSQAWRVWYPSWWDLTFRLELTARYVDQLIRLIMLGLNILSHEAWISTAFVRFYTRVLHVSKPLTFTAAVPSPRIGALSAAYCCPRVSSAQALSVVGRN